MNARVIPIVAGTLPPRPTEIHTHACANCPSTRDPDPEMIDIRQQLKAERMTTVFRCAWRPEKLCKGYCDYIEVTEADLTEEAP